MKKLHNELTVTVNNMPKINVNTSEKSITFKKFLNTDSLIIVDKTLITDRDNNYLLTYTSCLINSVTHAPDSSNKVRTSYK